MQCLSLSLQQDLETSTLLDVWDDGGLPCVCWRRRRRWLVLIITAHSLSVSSLSLPRWRGGRPDQSVAGSERVQSWAVLSVEWCQTSSPVRCETSHSKPMERRSRSQTRRAGELSLSGRHPSSSRDLPQPLSLPYSRPPDQARTLSPDRRDRYRASYRDSLPHQPPSSVPHSNSNSYNQYNHPYPLNHPAPRQQYSNNNVPPRPEPPTYTTSPSSVSPSKQASNLPAEKQVKYHLLEQPWRPYVIYSPNVEWISSLLTGLSWVEPAEPGVVWEGNYLLSLVLGDYFDLHILAFSQLSALTAVMNRMTRPCPPPHQSSHGRAQPSTIRWQT